jgi:hypothetical protein
MTALKLIHLLPRPYARASIAPRRLSSRLNELVLNEEIESAGPTPFASPVAGTQLLIPPQDRLALLHWVDGDFDGAWARLQAAGQVAKMDGRAIRTASELREAARRRAEAIGEQMALSLSRLGVLQ